MLTGEIVGLADGAEIYRTGFRQGLKPAPDLKVHEWADRYRMLSGVASAEEGRYRTSRTPFLKDIMDCLSPSSAVAEVVFKKPAQIGATEIGNNWVGFHVDVTGGAMLCVQPTVDMAKRWSKQRLAPLLRDTPRLAGKVNEARSRDSGNTLLGKEFAGGILLITGANSAVGLRSMPAPHLFFDEVDAYPESVDDEGHPCDIAWFRAAAFPFRKIFKASTPKVRHASRIDTDFEKSDQGYLYLPCPECREYSQLTDKNLVYPDEAPEECQGHTCVHCGTVIPEGKKPWMLDRYQWWRKAEDGSWIHRDPLPGMAVGFSLNALCAPIGLGLTWGEIAVQREEAKRDESKSRTYTNLVLGLSYEERSEAPDWERLYRRRESYRAGVVPAGAYVLVGEADIQRDRIEVSWYAFGPEFEAWFVDHLVIEGDTSRDEVWESLTKAQARTFPHAEGTQTLPADVFLVDMQYETEAVKGWVTSVNQPARVRAVRGEEGWGAPAIIGRSESELTVRGKKRKRGFAYWRLATASIKLEVYRRLRRDWPEDPVSPFGGPWIHYPELSEEWFKQLTAERIARKKVRSRRVRSRLEFEKTRDRNEALDLTVYAFAGAYMLKVEQLGEKEWSAYAARWGVGGREVSVPEQRPRVLSRGVQG